MTTTTKPRYGRRGSTERESAYRQAMGLAPAPTGPAPAPRPSRPARPKREPLPVIDLDEIRAEIDRQRAALS